MITRYELFISYQDIKIPEKQVKVKVSKNVLEITFLYFNTRKENVKVKVSNNVFWGSLSIPGRKAPRLHFRWEWIFCNPFTWKMHCDEKPKLALRSETKRKTFCMYFVISLYFFCYLFVFRFIIPSHETCISLRNQSLHCDQRPKGRLFVLQHLTSQGRKNTHSLYTVMT